MHEWQRANRGSAVSLRRNVTTRTDLRKPTMSSAAPLGEVEVSRRRAAAGFFSALGLVALTSCVDASDDGPAPELGTDTADLPGTTFSWVDTRANLRALAAPTGATSKVVGLEGCLAAGDGGGGVFFWSSIDTTPDDNGTVIQPTGGAAAGRWRRIDSGPLNARWFGAGLGAADDRATLQAVIDLVSPAAAASSIYPRAPSTIFNLAAAHYCQIADLLLAIQSGSPSTGAAITFTTGSTNVTIQRVYIGTMWMASRARARSPRPTSSARP